MRHSGGDLVPPCIRRNWRRYMDLSVGSEKRLIGKAWRVRNFTDLWWRCVSLGQCQSPHVSANKRLEAMFDRILSSADDAMELSPS
jgi:hypothetical protein